MFRTKPHGWKILIEKVVVGPVLRTPGSVIFPAPAQQVHRIGGDGMGLSVKKCLRNFTGGATEESPRKAEAFQFPDSVRLGLLTRINGSRNVFVPPPAAPAAATCGFSVCPTFAAIGNHRVVRGALSGRGEQYIMLNNNIFKCPHNNP